MKQIELRKAVENQKALQAEADHRVKNSLQSMSAIVRIYARTVTDDAARDALAAIQRRIDAVAALHEQLQGQNGRDTVDTDAYLTSIVSHLRDMTPPNVHIDAEFAPVILRSSHAANLAMIISEFVANSIKHAFPDSREGRITVRVEVVSPNTYRLECRDNGIGAQSSQPSPSRTQGIGLSLVSAAAANLSGQTQTDLTADGSHLVLEFRDLPLPETAVAE
jgi:two-component sensor histidine kinase